MKAGFSLAITAFMLSGLCAARPVQANPPAPLVFADGISVFTDVAGFVPAANKVCSDVDIAWFDSSTGAIGPANTIFSQTDDGKGVTLTSLSLLTGTDGHSDAQGPFSNITLSPTQANCKFTVLGFDLTPGQGATGQDIVLTLSGGDTITETIAPGNTFFGIIAPDGFTSASITSDATFKSLQQERTCENSCADDAVPEPGALSTLALGGFGLLGALLLGYRRFGKATASA